MANSTINELTQIQTLTQDAEFAMWDETTESTKKVTLQQIKNSIAEGIVAGVSFIGTRAQYEVAKLIPVGTDGHIPSGSLVIITDENRTYVTSGTGAEQTLQLVARVMSAGNGINISNDDKINADTVTFTGTRAEWEALSSSQKAKYNIVNFTDEELTDDVITDTVETGNMKAVTSNAVAESLSVGAMEVITLSSTETTIQKDGVIYIATSNTGFGNTARVLTVTLNGFELRSYINADLNNEWQACAVIPVFKGDTISAISTQPISARIRYYNR